MGTGLITTADGPPAHSSRLVSSRVPPSDPRMAESERLRVNIENRVKTEETERLTGGSHVVYKQMVSFRSSYAATAAMVIGVVHLLCGVGALVGNIIGILHGANIPVGAGILGAIFFFVSGSFAIVGAKTKRKCLVVATLVFAILSTIAASILVIISTYILSENMADDREVTLEVVVGVVMVAMAVTTSALTCRPLCCRSSLPYNSHPSSTSTSAGVSPEVGSDIPPTYKV